MNKMELKRQHLDHPVTSQLGVGHQSVHQSCHSVQKQHSQPRCICMQDWELLSKRGQPVPKSKLLELKLRAKMQTVLHYEVLGLKPYADVKHISRAYRWVQL